jgi:hypothetical protein
MIKIANNGSILVGIILTAIVIATIGQLEKVLAQDGGNFIYLPLIVGDGIKIPNGDFEAGRTIWTESSKLSNILIVQENDLPRGISPHNGNWAAWLGGDNDEQAYIEQSLFFNPDYRYLIYWYWIDWPFSCQGETGAVATIFLDQTVVHQTDVCSDTDTGGWAKQVIDLNGFAGQTVNLRFQLTTGINSFANFYLDDVALQISP